MKVLVVDDDRATRFILKVVLQREFGAEVVEAEHGLAAVNELEQRRFDAIFLDLHMPVMNGLRLLTAMRESHQQEGVPIVVLTSNSDERVVRQALDLGVAHYLVKPLDPRTVAERLGGVLKADS